MLYSTDADLDKLRSLLEGKTIKAILPPTANEEICRFVLTDGSSFSLHANDLGYWVENVRTDDRK